FMRGCLAQLVLHRLLEHNGIARDPHHEAVEYRIVFPQEISLADVVGYDCDKAVVRLHHAAQVDGIDLEALLAGRATRSLLLYHRAKARFAFPFLPPFLPFRLGFRRLTGLGRSWSGRRSHGLCRSCRFRFLLPVSLWSRARRLGRHFGLRSLRWSLGLW